MFDKWVHSVCLKFLFFYFVVRNQVTAAGTKEVFGLQKCGCCGGLMKIWHEIILAVVGTSVLTLTIQS